MMKVLLILLNCRRG